MSDNLAHRMQLSRLAQWTRHWLNSRSAVLASAALLVTASACRTPATQVELYLDTDAPADRAISLELWSFRGVVAAEQLAQRVNGTMVPLRLERSSNGEGSFRPGGSIGVLPASTMVDPSAGSGGVTLWIRAVIAASGASPEVRLDRAVRLSFVRGRLGTARVFLPIRCGDLSAGCSSVAADQCTVSVRCREQNATCGDLGECVQPEVPVSFPAADGAVEFDAPVSIDATSGRVDVANDSDGAGDSGGDVIVHCAMGEEAVGGRCVPPNVVPRPIAPLSLGNVSTRRPTLRWQLPAVFDGAFVELCRDRACTMVIESVRAMGSGTQPTMPLQPRSVVYWRVRGMVQSAIAMSASPTWLFHVPAVDAGGGIDSHGLTHFDVNADGFDDIVVGSSGASRRGMSGVGFVGVYHGTMSGVSLAPNFSQEGAMATDGLGAAVAGVGDLNGDGFGDLAIGAPTTSVGGQFRAGTVRVWYGSASGLDGLRGARLDGQTMNDNFGHSVAGAGDVNGDGYGDLLVGSRFASPGGRTLAGAIRLYLGSAMGISSVPARVFEGANADDNLGTNVAGIGDVNGDQFSDVAFGIALSDPGGLSNAGTVQLYYGGAMGLSMTPDRVLQGARAGDILGSAVAGAGDVNADGYGDLIVGAEESSPGGRLNAGVAFVYFGGAAGIGANPTITLQGEAAGDHFGGSVSSAGDVNGDGTSEIVVGAGAASPAGRMFAGRATVFLGGAGPALVTMRIWDGVAASDRFGVSVHGVGDVNRDGFADVVVGAYLADPGGRTDAGTANLFLGSLGGSAAMPSQLLEGLMSGDLLGISVALRTPTRSRQHNLLRAIRARDGANWL